MTSVSLLSPVWNEELHIEEMIRSVQAQTHEDWELLIVDDGSTDRTVEVVSSIAARDDRVRLVSSGEKLGKCGAFNLAWKAAAGDLICLLAGDDTLPIDSLTQRVTVLEAHINERAVGFFKIRTFSEQKRFNAAVLPRGSRGSRSGGSMTMTRSLARIVFPIPDTLPAEDVWLSHAIEAVSPIILDDTNVVLNYRIHPGNSNPRHKPFEQFNESLHERNGALIELLEQRRFDLPASLRARLETLARAETLRYAGSTAKILMMRELSIIDRLGIAQASSGRLKWARDRVYLLASGWRGR